MNLEAPSSAHATNLDPRPEHQTYTSSFPPTISMQMLTHDSHATCRKQSPLGAPEQCCLLFSRLVDMGASRPPQTPPPLFPITESSVDLPPCLLYVSPL